MKINPHGCINWFVAGFSMYGAMMLWWRTDYSTALLFWALMFMNVWLALRVMERDRDEGKLQQIEISAETCACPPNECKRNCDPPSDCVCRLKGDVRTVYCKPCKANTWHQDGQCIRCAKGVNR